MIVPSASSRPFDAVLCDVDNVIRFYDMSHVAGLEQRAGLAEGAAARVAYAPEVDLPLLLGQISTVEWVDSIERGLKREVSQPQARELAIAFAEAPFRADTEVVGLLALARKHVPLVLVTNATLDLESDLESLGLSDFADHVVSSARVGVAKPDPAIYEIAAKRAGVAADRCLFVDDRLENIEAAVALGMTGVHYQQPDDLREALTAVQDG